MCGKERRSRANREFSRDFLTIGVFCTERGLSSHQATFRPGPRCMAFLIDSSRWARDTIGHAKSPPSMCSAAVCCAVAVVRPMMTRLAKMLLLAAIALDYTLVAFNNLTDFNSNYEFVRHVLSMDTTFPGNHAMWRALPWPAVHLTFYWTIIVWEIATGVLLWIGLAQLIRVFRAPAAEFNEAKRVAVVAITMSLSMWLVAFLDVGGEWFLMWQSHVWNGQEEAFRMFVIVMLVMIFVSRPENETQV